MSDWEVTPESDWAVDAPAPAPPAAPSTVQSAARGAVQGASLGTGAAIQAALETAASKIPGVRTALQAVNFGGPTDISDPSLTYEQRRSARAGMNIAAQEAHPLAFGAGEIGGSLAAPLPGIGAVGALGTKVAGKLGGLAAQGLAAGTAFTVGSGLSEGKSASKIFREVGEAAPIAALAGPAVHLAGKTVATMAGPILKKAQKALGERYVRQFGSEVLGMTNKKGSVKAWNQILAKEAEPGVEIDAAKKFIQSPELAPVEKAARKHKWEDAIEKVDERLTAHRPARLQNYEQIEAAKPFAAGTGLDALDTALFKARNVEKNPQTVKALEKARNEWIEDYSSVPANALQRALLRPEGAEVTTVLADKLRNVVDTLPQSGRLSRSQIASAVEETGAAPDVIRYVNQKILDPNKGLMSWDPSATLPALELRAQATARQKSALQAFDALNPQHSESTKTAVKKAIVGALEQHLDDVGSISPELRSAVSRIRKDDVKFSVLLAAKNGLEQALEKTQVDQFKPSHTRFHVTKTGLAIEGAKMLGKHAVIGANRLTNAMERTRAAGAAGNARAADFAARVARASGPVGTVTQATLGSGQ